MGGKPVDRDEWKKKFPGASYLTGTIDWLHWGSESTLPWVDDLKCGKWPVDPKTSGQLRSYLLVPWIKAGMPLKDWEGVVSITQWPKYPLYKKPRRSDHRLTGLDLAEHLEEVRWAVDHPEEVNVTHDEIGDDGRIAEMSTCTFCDCRETHRFTGWMQHYKHRALPTCLPGALTQIRIPKNGKR